MARITVLDSTLCDGTLSPGYNLTASEKVRVANELVALGVDIIEVGSTVGEPESSEAIRRVASEVADAVIAARADLSRGSIERAAEALRPSPNVRIRVATGSADGRAYRTDAVPPEEWLGRVGEMTLYAKELAAEVEVAIEAATDTDPHFVARVVDVAREAGAVCVSLVAGGGAALPAEVAELVRTVSGAGSSARRGGIGIACGNDLGLAVAASLAGLVAGAEQVGCTVRGIGPRGGGAALEEVAVALHLRDDLALSTGLDLSRIHRASRLLAYLTGIEPEPGRPIVGRTVFQDVVPRAEPVVPGREGALALDGSLVGAPMSGASGEETEHGALEERFSALGYTLSPEELEKLSEAYATLAARKGDVLDEDLLSLIHHGVLRDVPTRFRLGSLDVRCGGERSTASVTIEADDVGTVSSTGEGDGPIAAVFDALDGAVDFRVLLRDLTIRSATPGRDALGEVSIHATIDGHSFTGRGAQTDVVRACAEAYLHAVNKAAAARALEEEHIEATSDMWGV